MTRRINLAVYSDATVLGGAEMNLSRVLGSLPEHVAVTLVGVDDSVVDWLRSHRPTSRALTLPAIESRTDLRGLLRHRETFRRLGADVLQFNLSTASSCQWAIFAATTIRGLRRVVIENSPMSTWSGLSTQLKRATSSRLAAHIAVGTQTARMIESSTGLPTESISTIYHGVPDVGREPVERSEEPTFLTVARHDPVKGVDVLLDAFALVEQPSRLVIVGGGPKTAELRAQCRALALDGRVEFREVPWDRRPADIMWAFDAFVLPSRLEGFPVTLVEAMLAGIPTIATEVGSVPEAVTPGQTGWIVPPENPEALARAMGEALAKPDEAAAMGKRAREVAEARFTIGSTVDAYMDLYEQILG